VVLLALEALCDEFLATKDIDYYRLQLLYVVSDDPSELSQPG
jgi:hypothetical protein